MFASKAKLDTTQMQGTCDEKPASGVAVALPGLVCGALDQTYACGRDFTSSLRDLHASFPMSSTHTWLPDGLRCYIHIYGRTRLYAHKEMLYI